MSDGDWSGVTHMLRRIQAGDASVSDQLLGAVYDELRQLAAVRMAREKCDHTLQATALVHEAWLRLAGSLSSQRWESRRHFFGAACEAMRRILVENARRKAAQKRGGEAGREAIDVDELGGQVRPDEVIAVHDALDELAARDPSAAELVKMRYFGGFSLEEAAEVLGLSRTSAYRLWAFARVWLRSRIESMRHESH